MVLEVVVTGGIGGSWKPWRAWELAIGSGMGVFVGLEFPGKQPKTRSSRQGKVNSGGIRRRQAFRRPPELRAEGMGTGGPTKASPVTYSCPCSLQISDTAGRYGGYVSSQITSSTGRRLLLCVFRHGKERHERKSPSQTSCPSVVSASHQLPTNIASEMCSRPCPSSHCRRTSWPRSSRPSSSHP